jgi:phospholipid N-methyltransferase
VPAPLGPERASSSFLQAFLSARKTIGAVRATSPGVARHMARLGGLATATAVAELGPGTGAITHELLAAMPHNARLFGFEIYEPFVEVLREAVHDARFELLQQSAETVAEVGHRETEQGFDAVISSLPFSLMGPELTRTVLHATGEALRPGGVFVALQYHPWYLKPYLKDAFEQVDREFHPVNVPPVLLFRTRSPRRR